MEYNMGNFYKLAYGTVKGAGYDTSKMTEEQVFDKFKELQKGNKSLVPKTDDIPKMGKTKDLLGMSTKELEEKQKFELPKKENQVIDSKKVLADNYGVKFVDCSSKELKDNLLKAKMTNVEDDRWRVDDTYTEQDYEHCKRFITSGGSTVAVKDNGDIVSVCKNQNDTQLRGSQLLQQAISKGGNKLDAFGKGLYNFYTKNGFEPVSWTPFNKEYAPHDWKEEYGEEHVVFYKYTGNKTSLTYDEFINKTKATSDYDTAYKLRDMEIKK